MRKNDKWYYIVVDYNLSNIFRRSCSGNACSLIKLGLRLHKYLIDKNYDTLTVFKNHELLFTITLDGIVFEKGIINNKNFNLFFS